MLKTKYETFERNVNKFNTDYPAETPMTFPTLEEVRRLTLLDPFWNIGQLTHPGEAWAVDPNTQDGIKAYRDRDHAMDELRRLARECRQSIKWGVCMEEKLSVLNTALRQDGE